MPRAILPEVGGSSGNPPKRHTLNLPMAFSLFFSFFPSLISFPTSTDLITRLLYALPSNDHHLNVVMN
jgi:hypothetical protein